MLLAGDIGGTKTLLGLFTSKPGRPSAIDVGEFKTLEYAGLETMIESFLSSRKVEARHIEAAGGLRTSDAVMEVLSKSGGGT